jgi:signal transduction histidine kinase
MALRSRFIRFAALGTSLHSLMPRVRFKSILGRIIFLHVIAIGIICVLMPLLLYWLLSRETDSLHQAAMLDHAEMLAAHLKEAGGGWSLDLPPQEGHLYSDTYGRYAYAVADATGKVVLSSLSDHALIFSVPSDNLATTVQQERHGKAVLFGISVPKEIDGKNLTIQVAENLRHRDVIIDDIVANFLQRVGWITLPILMMLLVIDIFIFRRALRPLWRASQEAQRIGPTQIDVRLPTANLPTEVLILVRAVNQAFDRLEQGFTAHREFTADAAHELRTPLAILRSRVDTFPESPISESVRQDVDRMSRVVNQLLDLAELETSVVAPGDVSELRSLCADVVEYVAPLAVRKDKEIALCGCEEPVWAHGNREMLFRALRNLAENAIAHSDSGTTVEIVLEKDATISVLDRGSGIREEHRELIFQRFWRGDRRHSDSSGLGLAIVARIAQANGGSITVENRPDGGARFTLRLQPDTGRLMPWTKPSFKAQPQSAEEAEQL